MRMNSIRTALLAAALLTLTACSGQEGGTALPTDPQEPSTVTSESATPPENGGSPTAGLAPCSLLSAGDLSQFGTFAEGEPKELGGARGCDFDKELKSASDDSVGVSVAVRDEQGVAEVSDLGSGVQAGNVPSGRKAASTSGNGTCLIALEVTETSRVDVGAVTNTDEQACEIADAVAEIVEPKLPKG